MNEKHLYVWLNSLGTQLDESANASYGDKAHESGTLFWDGENGSA